MALEAILAVASPRHLLHLLGVRPDSAAFSSLSLLGSTAEVPRCHCQEGTVGVRRRPALAENQKAPLASSFL